MNSQPSAVRRNFEQEQAFIRMNRMYATFALPPRIPSVLPQPPIAVVRKAGATTSSVPSINSDVSACVGAKDQISKKRGKPDSEVVQQKAAKKNRQDDVLKAIGDKPVTERHILECVGDNRYTREILRRLMALEVVQRVGKGGSNDPYLYRVVRTPQEALDAGVTDPALDLRMQRIEAKILGMLAEEKELITEKQIRAVVGDNTGTGKALRRLVKDQRVLRLGRGGAGDPFTYKANGKVSAATIAEVEKKTPVKAIEIKKERSEPATPVNSEKSTVPPVSTPALSERSTIVESPCSPHDDAEDQSSISDCSDMGDDIPTGSLERYLSSECGSLDDSYDSYDSFSDDDAVEFGFEEMSMAGEEVTMEGSDGEEDIPPPPPASGEAVAAAPLSDEFVDSLLA